MMIDADSQISFTGFMGEYEVTLGKEHVTFMVKEKREAHIAADV